MKAGKLSLREKVAEIKAKFALQLPERMAEAQRCYETMLVDHDDEETIKRLHLILHSINGTGNSLHYTEIGAIAARGEQLTTQLNEKLSAKADLLLHLGQCLLNMEVAVKSILNADGTEHRHSLSPQFEMPAIATAYDERAEKLIYICDDEPLHLALIAGQLLCFGYQTELFSSTSELRAAVDKQVPAILIMDIVFPGNTSEGTTTLSELRADGCEFPVIFVSVRKDFDARLDAIRAGGAAYFSKPVAPMELIAMLDNLIGPAKPEVFRILIVDDDLKLAEYVSVTLEDVGMLTKIVSKPEHVLETVNDFRPDLVLMDIYMPGCSGREVAKLIRQIPDFVSMPIVFLSTETDRHKQFSAMSIGADGFLTKPIDPEELVNTVSLRAERMRTLRSLMVKDSLTSLFNHTTTTHLLENAVQSARRQNSAMSFAMLDLDNFKNVNDSYGHSVGDQVLLGLARVLRQRLRKTDLIGRYGGEEFAIIMQDLSAVKAYEIMEQLRDYFGQVVFNAGEVSFSCTFSCGIASFPESDSLEGLREASDKALYEAKGLGRNQVISYQRKHGA